MVAHATYDPKLYMCGQVVEQGLCTPYSLFGDAQLESAVMFQFADTMPDPASCDAPWESVNALRKQAGRTRNLSLTPSSLSGQARRHSTKSSSK